MGVIYRPIIVTVYSAWMGSGKALNAQTRTIWPSQFLCHFEWKKVTLLYNPQVQNVSRLGSETLRG